MSNKAVLITGASKRIGRAVALACARAGYHVAIHYSRSGKEAATLASSLEALGVKAICVQADLSLETETKSLIAAASSALGTPMTALVNNASVFLEDDWDSAENETLWNTHFAVNLRAPYILSRALAKQIPPDQQGAIVNLVDQRVWRLNPTFFSYTLSKSAFWTMTRTLAQALAPMVRVNGVGPGPVLQSIHQDQAVFAHEADNTPLRQSVEPDEVAQACLYLLTAKKVTGQMIAVDSGQHLSWRTPDVEGPSL
ncbi:MAG: SDR family oxidoreductase [Pseudomonadota bacterium]